MKTQNCKTCGKVIYGTQKWYLPVWWNVCEGHNYRVSELSELTLGELSDDDCVMITDMSEKMSKKVSIGNLKRFFR